MSSSVSIDIASLEGAISALTGLASRIDSQRMSVLNGTPCSVPSLSDGTIAAVSAWLTEQEPELSTRLDLAKLLAGKGGTSASYTSDADTLANVQAMLGKELADRVNDVSYDTDPEDLEWLNEMLSARADDPDVMSEMYQDLEPQGVARAITMLESNAQYGGGGETPEQLAETLRKGLATASTDPSFPAETYGHEMVRWFVAPMLTDDEQRWMSENDMMSMNGASLLSFMMRDVDYSADFLTGAADTLDEFEHLSKDGPFGDAAVWYNHNGYSFFNQDDQGSYADPMAEMMRAMSRQPEVGYDFITEGDRADFYFDKRDWSNDGYDGIAALADRVSTDPDVYAAHPEGAAMVASQFVDWTANSEGFNPEDARAAGDSIGHLLKSYMPSMAAAMDGGPEDLDPALLAVNPKLPGFGELENMPAFYREDLEKMTGVAMANQDGMTSIAEGMADYRQTQLLAVADQLKDDPDNAKLINQLNAVALDDSELRGFTTKIAGQTQIDDAHSTDEQRQFFVNLLSESAKAVPIPVPGANFVVGQGIDLGTDAINDSWGNTANAVTDNAEDQAQGGVAQMNYEAYTSLIDAGVIPEDQVPEEFFGDDGQLRTWSDVHAGDGASSYAARASQEIRPWIADEDLENTYARTFQTYYDNPGGGD